jgi:hypothetical protein
MYNHKVRFDDDYFAKAQTVPANDSADGNGGVKDFSNLQASLEILAIANEDITIAAGKNFTIKLQDCATALGTFADFQTIYSLASPAAQTVLAAGTQLGESYTISKKDEDPYLKIVLTTNDAAATGKVDVFPHYIAR